MPINLNKRFSVSLLCAIVVFAVSLLGCATRYPHSVVQGLQPVYKAISPSLTLCLPTVFAPYPRQGAFVDKGLFQSAGADQVLQSAILEAFSSQPGVSGVSCKAVHQRLLNTGLLQNFIDLIDEKILPQPTANNSFNRYDESCQTCAHILSWYKHNSGLNKQIWNEMLMRISSLFRAADAGLLPVVFEASEVRRGDKRVISVSGAILLLEMNTTELMWGREFSVRKEWDIKGGDQIWQQLFSSALSEKFWEDYPSRLPRNTKH